MKIPKALLRFTIFSRWYIMEEKKKDEIKNKIVGLFKRRRRGVRYHNCGFIDWEDITARAILGICQGLLASMICLLIMLLLGMPQTLVIGMTIGVCIGNAVYRFMADDLWD